MLRIKMKGAEREDLMMNVITLNIMAKAISNRIGIKKEKAKQIASFIMDLFGYDTRIIDNVLEPGDRQLLYMLETEGLITTGREEQKLYDGREWLTHYWELRKKIIIKYAKNRIKNDKSIITIKNKNKSKRNIYSTLTEDMWIQRKNNNRDSTHNYRIL
jgi:hypothetical protein